MKISRNKLSVIILLFFFTSIKCQNLPVLNWVTYPTNGTSNQMLTKITTDKFGNVYSIGINNGFCDFDPSSNLNNVAYGLYLSKNDSLGNLLWAKGLEGGTSGVKFFGLSCDSIGNVYIAGSWLGLIDMDPSPTGTINLAHYGSNDIFVAKYDHLGNHLWSFSIGSNGFDDCSDLIIKNNSLYIVGSFFNSIDFDPSNNNNIVNLGTCTAGYLAKYDLNGAFIWTKVIAKTSNSTGDVIPTSIDIDNFNNIVVGGNYSGTIDFDPSIIGTAIETATVNFSTYFQKYDLNGNFLWVKTLNTLLGNSTEPHIKCDGNSNIIVGYSYYGIIDIDPSPVTNTISCVNPTLNLNEIFLAKYNSNGLLLWGYGTGGTSSTYNNITSVETSKNNEIFITGDIGGTVDFDFGPSINNLTTTGGRCAYLAKYTTTGQNDYAFKIDGTSNFNLGSGMAVHFVGDNFYFGGAYSSLLTDFDPSNSSYLIGPSCNNCKSFFLSKYKETNIITNFETKTTNKLNINIYPNPTNNLVILNSDERLIEVNVVNQTGQILITKKNLNSNTTEFSLYGFPTGIYFFEIKSANGRICKKIVKN